MMKFIFDKVQKKHIRLSIFTLAFMIISVLSMSYMGANLEQTVNAKTTSTKTTKEVAKTLSVHYIDVGQGDAILIQYGDKSMLIDAGENNQGKVVVNYIKALKIKKLDYVIGTHPHSDHIGGLDTVINSFSIGKIIMPEVTSTTKTFEDVIDAIAKKKLKLTKPVVGTSYKLGDAEFTILAPNGKDYSDSNNYSVVVKLTYKDTSFLFTGDAEDISEKEMLDANLDLSADVLKVGHHGSNSSTTCDFLEEVDPKYAIISVGKDNEYKHPTQATLDKLTKADIEIYRTDECGTIIATSDGKKITFDKSPSEITPTPTKTVSKSNTVYVTKTGKKYHLGTCPSLSKSKINISLKDAKKRGFEPCKKCNPPE